MKNILCLLPAVMIFFSAHSQTFTPVREIYVNENSVGDIKFIQGDFDQDGDIEFLADANYGRNFFIGTVHNNQIVTQRSSIPQDADTDFIDLRYEDADGDGHNEMYVLFEAGLVSVDTQTFIPIDTILLPGSFTGFIGMYLFDVNQDQKKEWVLMDEYSGIFIIDPTNDSIISSNNTIKGRAFHIANLDEELDFELIVVTDDDIFIMDLETYAIEHSFPVGNAFNTRTHDLNHDGADELFICDNSTFKIYYHQTKTFETFSSDPGDFSDFIFYNADADPADEIQLYLWNSSSEIIALQTYPLSLSEKFEIEGDIRLGVYLDISLQNQNEYIFNLPPESSGLVFYNPVTRKARITEPSEQNSALLIDRLGIDAEESMVSSPDENGDFFDILSLTDMERKDRITGDDLFKELHVTLNDKISTFNIKGIENNMLVVSTDQDISIVDLANGPHREFYYFIPSSESFHADDLDFDGQKEFIMANSDEVIIRRFSGGLDYTETIFPFPSASIYAIVTAQLNETPEKEIILYRAFDIYVINSLTGEEIDHFTDMVPGWMTDMEAYSDGHGTFYLAVTDNNSVYIHNYTTNSYVTTFQFENDDDFEVLMDHFQLIGADTVETYLTLFIDKFNIYNSSGYLLYTAPYELSGSGKKVLVSDYNKDQQVNIFTSTQQKLTEYEHSGGGAFHRSFYMPAVYPQKGAAINHVTPFFIQFSEAVDPSVAQQHVQVMSKIQGLLNFTTELINPHEWKITPQASLSEGDTIRIFISGNLQSRLAKYIDINYDGVAFGATEGTFESYYVVRPAIPNNPVSINAEGTLASIVYSENIRHFPLKIESEAIHGPAIPIAAAYSGIMTNEVIRSSFNLPVDSVFDESTEEINVAINTFGLTAGDYTGFLVAMDYHGHWSDTFFFSFTLIEEGKHMDKNPGSNRQNSFAFDNNLQSTPYALKKILTHAPFTKISDVTGGDGAIYYSELPNTGTTGKIHKIDLDNFDSDWVRILPMEDQPSPLHLDNGFLYFYNYTDQLWKYDVVSIDAITGKIESNTTYDALIDYMATPITDEYSLLMPGGSPRGYYSFNRWTGQINWFREIEPYAVDRQSVATIYADKAYIMNGRFVYSLEKSTGSLIWTFEHGAPVLEDITYVIADEKNHQLFVTAMDSLYAIDAESGTLNWSHPVEFNSRQSILHGNEIIHFGIDSIRVFDALNGTRKRQKLHFGILYGQPVAASGKLFIPYSSNMEVWDINTLSQVWSVNLSVSDISILDNYLILKEGNSLHIYKSENQCCNPSITWTEATYGISGGATSRRFGFDPEPYIFNGKVYHEIIANDAPEGGSWVHTGEYLSYHDRSLFHSNLNTESRAADFSLDINDSFQLPNGPMANVVGVDSIQLENGETRRRLELRCDANDRFYWIEGIGSTTGNGSIHEWCNYDIYPTLLCHYLDGELLYMNPEVDTCWLMITSTNEEEKSSITFSPNPVTDELVIIDPDQLIGSVVIADTYGRIRKAGNELRIDVSSLTSGIYILHLQHKSGHQESRMFIKL